MKKRIVVLSFSLAIILCFCASVSLAENKWESLVEECGKVLAEIQDMPDKGIPAGLLKDCKAIAIFPSTVSGGFIIGGKYGQGIILAKDDDSRGWSAPAIFTMGGGSFGLQIGGQATDFVLLIMTRRSVDGILHGKFKLGADAAVSAGPVGRNAEASTDVELKGGILSYSRSRGLFAGVKLAGDVITQHWDANKALYGKDVSAKEIIDGNKVGMPASASQLLKVLNKYR